MSHKTLIAVDLAIETLREQMALGKANTQISILQLDELNCQRQELVRGLLAEVMDRNDAEAGK